MMPRGNRNHNLIKELGCACHQIHMTIGNGIKRTRI
ncbi:hypothetical protein MGSAQ_001142 [marine sediment metagenome]|uniref:Uncharacterized protein n=1 Tax=marine sediment metagenome TaxID=412755 RepID=A0A1B6NWL8_9ZZZZ